MRHASDRVSQSLRLSSLRRRLLCCALLLAWTGGCATTSEQWVKVRDTPSNPLAGKLQLLSTKGPKPSPRTQQLLRRYNLADQLGGNRTELLARLEELQLKEPNLEIEYAMAELAYLAAKRSEAFSRDRAVEFYGTALVHAYRYLLDDSTTTSLNPYDPQFRGASDLYNQSLEGMLRLVHREGHLHPGRTLTIQTANHTCSFDIVLKGSGWHDEDFERFEFVSDYQIEGLRNHYRKFGLGVPLIAVRGLHDDETPSEQFYAPGLAFPVTAFLKVLPQSNQFTDDSPNEAVGDAPQLVLELHDPLERNTIEVAGKTVPLESDLSTPLAYFLNQPELSEHNVGTIGLLKPGRVEQVQGLYMLEPFDPTKMPVVMVHGLWSSPLTWMEMFNDLRSDPLVRQHYQFWFYLYPTGEPFWQSAAQMRTDLADMRSAIDPANEHPALDQTVLIGHSMGGLVSKLQSVESSDGFWDTMSEQPFAELVADNQIRDNLESTFFFKPNPAVRRVVTIGTPHRGSPFANGVTRWLSGKIISIPSRIMHRQQQLVAKNPNYFRKDAPLDIRNSIDSLDPKSPLLTALLDAEPAPWISYHNIVGKSPDPGLKDRFVGEGDGVVALASAQLDSMRQLRSQLIVGAEHVSVHRHPQSILEVRRVLLEQLSEIKSFPYDVQVASTDVETNLETNLETGPETSSNEATTDLHQMPALQR